jgi:hypothetical protein
MANPTETNRGSKFIDILDSNSPLYELSLSLRFMQSFQLLAHGRWFSAGTPASPIAEILLNVALNTIN